jgi:hypothetical protein
MVQTFKEFCEMFLPDCGLEKSAVAARLGGKWQQEKFPIFQIVDFLLRDAKLRRIPRMFPAEVRMSGKIGRWRI